MRTPAASAAALLAGAALALGAGCASGGEPAGGAVVDAPARSGIVERVSDGDTVRVRIDGTVERVRLLGIDAPEREREDHAGECWAERATRAAADLLPGGARISVVADPGQGERDRFGRLLGQVYAGAGGGPVSGEGSVNLALVRAGAARVYVYRRSPFTGADRFIAAERDARDADRGLWGPPCEGRR